MTQKDFLREISNSKEDILQLILNTLNQNNIPFCIIGGFAVNAYVEPVVTLDLDIVIVAEKIQEFLEMLNGSYSVKKFPNSINIQKRTSDLRIQLQTDPRYFSFVKRAKIKSVLGYKMPVAKMEDVLQGKIWSATDPLRRASKRQKDLADILRLIEKNRRLVRLLPAGLKRELKLV